MATKTKTGARIAVFSRVTTYLAFEVRCCGIFVTFLPLLFFWGNWIERVWKFDTFGPQPHNDLGFTVCQKLSLSNKQNHNPSPFETLFRTKPWRTLGNCLTYTSVRFFSRILGDISLCRIAKVETEKLKISFPSLLEFVLLSVIFVWSSKLTSANKFIHGDIGKLDTHFCDQRNHRNSFRFRFLSKIPFKIHRVTPTQDCHGANHKHLLDVWTWHGWKANGRLE